MASRPENHVVILIGSMVVQTFASFLRFFFLLEVARLFNLFIIHIRCRDPWKAFAEKGGCTTVVKRKCKIIVKNSKEQVQFTTLWKALQKWYKEKQKQEGIFREE